MRPPVKLDWLDNAIEIHKFHIAKLKDNPSWTVEKTALSLNRSLGAISQYILLGSWVKTHERQLRHCVTMRDALKFIRAKQYEMRITEIE